MATYEELIQEMINQRVWAVVGASNDPRKYGYKIFRSMLAAGYRVYPVNPRGGEIEGQMVYERLSDLPEKPDVVDFVVPPQVTEKVVREMHELGLERAWMQPGAESDAAVAYCEANGIKVLANACAMVQRRQWNDQP